MADLDQLRARFRRSANDAEPDTSAPSGPQPTVEPMPPELRAAVMAAMAESRQRPIFAVGDKVHSVRGSLLYDDATPDSHPAGRRGRTDTIKSAFVVDTSNPIGTVRFRLAINVDETGYADGIPVEIMMAVVSRVLADKFGTFYQLKAVKMRRWDGRDRAPSAP